MQNDIAIGASCGVCGEQYTHRDDCELKPRTDEENAAIAASYDCVPKRDRSGALIQPTANHDKVYSDFMLASNPPQRMWICRKCGTQGTESDRCANVTEYDQLIAKFGGGRVIGISYGV